jgi:hypothetical protein
VPGSLDPGDPDGSYGAYWILWCLLDPMVPTGFYGAYWILWCLLDPRGSSWILMDPTEYIQMSVNSISFHLLLLVS